MSDKGAQAKGTSQEKTSENPRTPASKVPPPPITPHPSSSPTVTMPDTPKMGTVVESYPGKADWSYMSGGKPNATWTSFVKEVENDSQLRTLDNAHKAKNKKTLEEPLPESQHYKKGVAMHTFSKELFEHFQRVGLDTITYLPDLSVDLKSVTNSVSMHSVVSAYPRFGTFKERALQVACFYAENHFDKMDKDNSESAKAIFFKSIDSSSKEAFSHLIEPKDCFAVVWIHFLSTAIILNEDTILSRRTIITGADPKAYEHENISKLCQAMQPHVKALVNVGRYESSVSVKFLQALINKTTPNKTFELAIGLKLEELEKETQPLAYLQPYEQNLALQKKQLDPLSLLTFVEGKFLSLYNATPCLWQPATGKTDPLKALLAQPTGLEDKSFAQLILLALKQSNKDGEGGVCFNCGASDHWAADCPKKKQSGKNSKRGKKGNGGNSNQRDNQKGKKTGWKYQRPSDVSKPLQRNGKTFFWCEKCSRFSTTHGTAQHGNKSDSSSSDSSSQKITYAAALDPSLWLAADINSIVTPSVPVIGWVVPFFAAVSLGLFILGRNRLGLFATLFQNLLLSGSIIASNASGLFQVALQSTAFVADPMTLAFQVLKSLWILDPCFFIAPALWIGTVIFLLFRKRRYSKSWSNQCSASSGRKYSRSYRRRLQQFTKKQKLRFHRLLQRCLLGDTIPPKKQVKGRFRRMNRKGRNPNFCSLDARRARQRWLRRYNAAQFVIQNQHCGGGRSHRRVFDIFVSTRPVHTRRSCQSSYHVHSPVTRLTGSQRALLLPSFSSFFNAFGNTPPLANSFPVIWDSGASCCVSNNRDDFVSFSSDVGKIITSKSLCGLNSSGRYEVEGEGYVVWYVPAVDGTLRSLKLPCAFIPKSEVRLLSTQVLWNELQESFIIKKDGLLEGKQGDPLRKAVAVPCHRISNLLVTMCTNEGANPSQKPSSSKSVNFSPAPPAAPDPESSPVPDPSSILAAFGPPTSESNANLSEAQKCLLRWHYRLGHVGFDRVKFLLGSGVLAVSESAKRLHRAASSSSLELPKCRACLHAKQRVRSPPKRSKGKVTDHPGVLKQDNLLPGQAISVDHMICSQPGRRFNTRGKESDKSKFKGACVFVDHASAYIDVQFQSVLTSHATLESKANFEAICRDVGVVPQKYVMDNAKYFTSKEFTAHMSDFRQIQAFAGVGAHHQNAIAERSIQTITSIARAMMIHAALHWPEVADSSLWPMAIKQATWLWNHMPNPSTGLSPADIFTRSRYPLEKLHDVHVFGCPAYVLEKTLADGKKLPRWKPRSTQCIYLGRADEYASSVYSLLNLQSGSITPQYHVVMDDWFATVSSSAAALPDFNSPEWIEMFGKSELQYFGDDELDTSAVSALNDSIVEARHREATTSAILERFASAKPRTPLISSTDEPTSSPSGLPPMPTSVGSPAASNSSPAPTSSLRENSADTDGGKSSVAVGSSDGSADAASFEPNVRFESDISPKSANTEAKSPHLAGNSSSPSSLEPKPSKPPVLPSKVSKQSSSDPPSALRRSNRRSKQPERMNIQSTYGKSYYTSLIPSPIHFHHLFAAYGVPCIDDSPSLSNGGIFVSKKNKDPDLFSYHEAMRHPDREQWIKSAVKEIEELESHGVWEEVPLSSVPKGAKVVPCTWVFRIKRAPDGTVKKYKGRICLRGDLMESVGDVFAPVVAYPTIRCFLLLSLLLGWETCSIDFSNAFCQSDNPYNTFMKVPLGFTTSKPNCCLRLKKSLYGATYSPKLWYEMCSNAFIELGFERSKYDHCLFYKSDIFLVLYVDDTGIAYKNKQVLDEFIQQLRDKGFQLTLEGTFTEFLGIQYHKDLQGNIHLTQDGLIKKILETTGLSDSAPNKVPCRREPLGIDADGEPFSESWSYPSVAGMLLYLSTNTRTDIAFAVSQICRFTHNPKQSHAKAVKILCRYLKGTIGKGTIIKPTNKLRLDCFCDADFAGLYNYEPHILASSVKSRGAYVIKLSGCPLVWKTQLMPSICLSTAEAEYYSLSLAMRALLPVKTLLEEMVSKLSVPKGMAVSKIVSTAHEDNSAALSLAVDQRLTNRTRHYLVRWHFFWSIINDKENKMEIVYCPTKEQEADYLTKGLDRITFEYLRSKVQGW
ncbi:hypothetical protein CTEN210_04045 [Chaetoceros tenuissimus]|uniref:Uncharacterized protein n=1 Tax=Chaetoceros tenuissimus TaxID=426638 RepID=A0AAD3H248_9STRA|nr:hypothetical protein CTEN210_04045 [Chaetoceros tenuissimus]